VQEKKNVLHLSGADVHKDSSSALNGSLKQRIHAVYRQLPRGEGRVADLLLQDPGELLAFTATELAERSGVSNATVSRFFRRLGFSSFDEARQIARQSRLQGSPLHGARGATRETAFLPAMMREEVAVLEATLSALNPLTLREIADALCAARRIRVGGFRNSNILARYLCAGLAQLRPDVAMMMPSAQSAAEDLAQLGSGDVAILIGMRRRPASFNDLVAAVAETGAPLLLVSDNSIRSAPALARWTLTCEVRTPQSYDSYVGVMAVLRALVISVDNRLGKAGRDHLERVEAIHARLSDLE
jgi:DNA-binding MurR/RpiR family transcriptional regulator